MSLSSVGDKVHAEQVRLLYARLPAAIVTVPLTAGVLLFVFWGAVSQERLLSWFGAVILVTVLRLLSFTQFSPTDTNLRPARWGQVYMVLIGVSGALWGAGAFWILPPDQIAHESLFCLIVAGMGAGAVTSAQSYPPALILYIGTSIVPLVVRLASVPDKIHLMMAGLALFFGLMMILIGRGGGRRVRERIELRRLLEQAIEARDAQKWVVEDTLAGQRKTRDDLTRIRRAMDSTGLGAFLVDAQQFSMIDVTEGALSFIELSRTQALRPGLTIADLRVADGWVDLGRWQSLAEQARGSAGGHAVEIQRTGKNGAVSAAQLICAIAKDGEEERLLMLLRPLSP